MENMDTAMDLGIDIKRHVGFDFDHYDPLRLPKLPEDVEDNKWYAKFYYQGRTELPDEMTKHVQIDTFMDSKYAILPGKEGGIDKLMQPGFDENDLGYCLLPNGCAYASVRSELPGITPEMNDWYKRFRIGDKLAYMIWYPGSHDNETDGITQEDVGFGQERFEFEVPASIKNLGFSCHPAETDPLYVGIVGGGGRWVNLEDPEITPRVTTLFHYMRRLPDREGLEFRTHLYIGMFIVDGHAVVRQVLQPEIALECARRLAHHCIYERANMASFLPELYDKMKDTPLAPPENLRGAWMLNTESAPEK